ncbi:MAG: helicase-related protein [Nanobdellota archaeon]
MTNDNIFISDVSNDPVINICNNTLKENKQALVFCSSKNSAEKQAEEIAKFFKKKYGKNQNLEDLSEFFLNVLPQPTEQCKRNAKAISQGIAFHHAGLASKQKNIIEDAFRNGKIRFICCTPTLAAGLDMPAFRTVIKDLKRFSPGWGMQFIPVMEYEQMAGRAGRPGKENIGESIVIAKSDKDFEIIKSEYINGEVEDIFSKLAAEPVLRAHVLSLISCGFCNSKEKLIDFFKDTFYAKTFGDMDLLEDIILKVVKNLKEWEFLVNEKKESDFMGADQFGSDNVLSATQLGRRVSELYLDPYTASRIIDSLKKASDKKEFPLFGIVHTISNTLEMRPLLRISNSEKLEIYSEIAENEDLFLQEIPEEMDFEFDDFLKSFKTAKFFMEWINEKKEDFLLKEYSIRPGEIKAKLDSAEWIIKSTAEIAKVMNLQKLINDLYKLQIRVKDGVKGELLPLLKLKGVGRVRARALFDADIKNVGLISSNKIKVKEILGDKISEKVFDQLGIKSRKGNLMDFV